ncbi:hypothetical protein [Nostoc commune]|nr:hypothetical protein [Nostoc commune]
MQYQNIITKRYLISLFVALIAIAMNCDRRNDKSSITRLAIAILPV